MLCPLPSSWRGRDKETHAVEAADPSSDSENGSSHQLPPPPPYREREWTPISHPIVSASRPFPSTTVTTPRRKIVHRSGKRIRRTRAFRPQTAPSPERVGPSSHTPVEPDPGQDNGDDHVCFASWVSLKTDESPRWIGFKTGWRG